MALRNDVKERYFDFYREKAIKNDTYDCGLDSARHFASSFAFGIDRAEIFGSQNAVHIFDILRRVCVLYYSVLRLVRRELSVCIILNP